MRRIRARLLILLLLTLGTAPATAQQQTPAHEALDQIQAVLDAFAAAAEPTVPGLLVRVPAGGDLQAALEAAPPGAVVELEPGAVYGPVALPAGKPGTLRTRGFALPAGTRVGTTEPMALIQSTSTTAAIRAGAGVDDWIVEGVEAHTTAQAGTAIAIGTSVETSLAQLPRRVSLRHVRVQGGTAGIKRCVGLHGIDVEIVDSSLTGCYLVGFDSQAVWINHGDGIRVRNNHLEGASENLMTGGAAATIPNESPRNVLIEGNTFTKDPAWRTIRAQVKNLLEFKHVRGAIVRGNTFSGNWADAQAGAAILFSPRAQTNASPWTIVEDVTFEHNIVRDTPGGIALTGDDSERPSRRTRNIVIQHNLFVIDRGLLGPTGRGGDGRCLTVGRDPQDWTYAHNTCIANGSSAIYVYAGGDRVPQVGVTIAHNLLRHNTYGVNGQGSIVDAAICAPLATCGLTGWAARTLAFFLVAPVWAGNVVGGAPAARYPAGTITPSVAAWQDGFLDWAAGDYRLRADVAWAGAGADLARLPGA